jgi:CRISPR-associated protein Cmr4
MQTKLLYLFTRTPLHVGVGASGGAIDQPVQRERHTGFPIIPASSLKGSFADQWPTTKNGKRLSTKKVREGDREKVVVDEADDAAWLFGSDTTDLSFAGSLLFSEARVIAFPIRSAKGSFAWITCPLMLQRARRDGVINSDIGDEPGDDQALFKSEGPLALDGKIVLEEYCFNHTGTCPDLLAKEIAALVADSLLSSISERLVILSNGMMSHFASTTCEVAQHVRISDETGTAEGTGLFNQENVPADTLFYAVLHATAGRGEYFRGRTPDEAFTEFESKLKAAGQVFQFGGDASTGLGFCTVTLSDKKGA